MFQLLRRRESEFGVRISPSHRTDELAIGRRERALARFDYFAKKRVGECSRDVTTVEPKDVATYRVVRFSATAEVAPRNPVL